MARTGLGRPAERAALGAIAFCLLIELLLIRVGIDDLDEGYFAAQAWRVVAGELPYRDFDSLYTPGITYLHAALFGLLGGPHLLGPRVLAWLARAAGAFGLYALGRGLGVRPLFAALPSIFLLVALDEAPEHWRPHPGWYTNVGTVAVVALVARLPVTRPARRAWLLFAVGLAIAAVFAFKQNTGVFLGLATAGFLLLQGHNAEAAQGPVSPPLRLLQIGALALVLGMVLWVVRPYATPGVVLYLVAPVAATGALLLVSGSVARGGGRGVGTALQPVGWVVAGFLAGTLPWLAALVAALGGRLDRLAGFVGAGDQAALYWPLELSDRAGLTLLLPVAALWVSLWRARPEPATVHDWRLRWYLSAAAFTFLTQYPRLDLVHLAWSAPLALVLGAAGLDRVYLLARPCWNLGTVRGSSLVAALLVLPAMAALPALGWRAAVFLEPPFSSWPPSVVPLTALRGLPSVEGFLAPSRTVDDLQGVVAHLRSGTSPGEAVLVYPSSPLLYILAERPNPTRFTHLYPGAATELDLQEIIRVLDRTPVRLVVVSDFWLRAWGEEAVRSGARSTLPDENRMLEDYIEQHYAEEARYGAYRVLRRGE